MNQEASLAPDTGHGAETPSDPAHWLDEAVDQDVTYHSAGQDLPLREHPGLRRYGSVADMAQALISAQSLVGRKTVGLTPLPEDASPQQREQFETELRRLSGVPDSPDDYELALPQGQAADEALTGWFKQAAHEAGLSPQQARALSEGYNDVAARALARFGRDREARKTDTLRVLDDLWGRDAASNLETAKRGFMSFAQRSGLEQDEIETLLTAYGDEPVLIRLFHTVGAAFAEDRLVQGAAGPPHRSQAVSPERFFAEDVFGGKGE